MSSVHRRVSYKLYPSASQARALERVCDLHRELYNAALQERIVAWREWKSIVSFTSQCKSLTQIRKDTEEYREINCQSLQVTLKRLDLAFGHFLRRVRMGQTPGFPRFKSRDRFPGFGFKTHGDGFQFKTSADWRHGKLRLSGIGCMRVRGEARTSGRIVSADIQRKSHGWFLSLVVECVPYRECGDKEAGLDWGVETFATLAYSPGVYAAFENDRPLDKEKEALKEEQRKLSKAMRGRWSNRARKARRAMARRFRKVANRRKERNHQITARLVREHKLLITEKLAVPNMTATARGTILKPGKNVRAKAGLNRSILDATPGSFVGMLAYKAEEAGCELIVLDPRKEKPSQTCPACGTVRKKALSEREHKCGCGFAAMRDQASSLAMLAAGLRLKGREPSWAMPPAKPETSSRAA